jgi:ribosomal protein L3
MVAGPVSQVCGPRPAAFPFDCDMIWGARTWDMAEQRRAAGGLVGAPCGASSPARVMLATRRAPHRTAHRMTGQNLSHSAAVDDHLLI